MSNSELFAEIGRLNVLLNERDKEIERLKGLMPPDDTSFVGQAWSPFAEKLRLERDALREEVVEKDKEIEWLRGERPAVVVWLRRTSERMNDATLAHAADCIEDGEHRVEETE